MLEFLTTDILGLPLLSWLIIPPLGMIVGAVLFGRLTLVSGYIAVMIFFLSRLVIESVLPSGNPARVVAGLTIFSLYTLFIYLSFRFMTKKYGKPS